MVTLDGTHIDVHPCSLPNQMNIYMWYATLGLLTLGTVGAACSVAGKPKLIPDTLLPLRHGAFGRKQTSWACVDVGRRLVAPVLISYAVMLLVSLR